MDVFERQVGVPAVEAPGMVKLCKITSLSQFCRVKVMIVAPEQNDLAVAVGSRNQRSMNSDYVAGRNQW